MRYVASRWPATQRRGNTAVRRPAAVAVVVEQTDGQTDRETTKWTNEQTESSPPPLSFLRSFGPSSLWNSYTIRSRMAGHWVTAFFHSAGHSGNAIRSVYSTLVGCAFVRVYGAASLSPSSSHLLSLLLYAPWRIVGCRCRLLFLFPLLPSCLLQPSLLFPSQERALSLTDSVLRSQLSCNDCLWVHREWRTLVTSAIIWNGWIIDAEKR